jgi:hypothetical protein
MEREPNRKAWVSLSIVALVGCATSPPGLALRKVVIYRNGVGYFERAGHVQSDRVQFLVRKEGVDDFLATLAVLERGGSSVRSASFPLDAEGADDEEPGSRGSASHGLRRVVMSLDGKEHDLQVGYTVRTPVWRPSYRLLIDKDAAALQTWGVVQNLSGEDWVNVSLSLAAAAPLTFDTSLATAVTPPRPSAPDRLDVMGTVPHAEASPGRATPTGGSESEGALDDLMEDALSSEDSGGRLRDQRPQRRSAGARRGGLGRIAKGGSAAGAAATPALPPPTYSRQVKDPLALAAVTPGAGSARYDLPGVVTIPDQGTTMVMLQDQRVPGEVVAMFAPDDGVPESAVHPFRVARFSNNTGASLEGGPLAIFSDGAFAGQGMTDPLPAGATIGVPFGLDRQIAVEVTRQSTQEGLRISSIEAGTLTIALDEVSLTTYRLDNGADRATKAFIKHARRAGGAMNHPPAGTEEGAETGSVLVPVQIGAHATATVVLDERKVASHDVDWIASVADEAVQGYLSDPHADPAVAAQLKVAWEIRRVLGAANEEREKLASEQKERRRETEETRANLEALEKNTAGAALRAKLTGRLADDSARLDALAQKLLEINGRIDENQVRFADAVRAIDLRGPASEAVPAAEAAPFVASVPPPTGPRPTGPRIQVVAATWGQNCHAPYGNVTSYLQAACDYKSTCDYPVTHDTVPDPAVGCGKTYVAEWRCDGDSTVHRATLPRGADWGHIVRLTCEGPAAAERARR